MRVGPASRTAQVISTRSCELVLFRRRATSYPAWHRFANCYQVLGFNASVPGRSPGMGHVTVACRSCSASTQPYDASSEIIPSAAIFLFPARNCAAVCTMPVLSGHWYDISGACSSIAADRQNGPDSCLLGKIPRREGNARHGEARQGKAKQGKNTTRSRPIIETLALRCGRHTYRHTHLAHLSLDPSTKCPGPSTSMYLFLCCWSWKESYVSQN
ncbi:hypothetical protein HDV62DRAFT_234757 [Trichoderma sp. SZMC 28011]